MKLVAGEGRRGLFVLGLLASVVAAVSGFCHPCSAAGSSPPGEMAGQMRGAGSRSTNGDGKEGPRASGKRQKVLGDGGNRGEVQSQRGEQKLLKRGLVWKIGLVSDTHGQCDEALKEALQGVDELWHTGDIAGKTGSWDSARTVLDSLEQIAPIGACVRGNTDSFAGGLRGHRGASEANAASEHGANYPEVAVVHLGEHTAVLTHISGFPKGGAKPTMSQSGVTRLGGDAVHGGLVSEWGLAVPAHLCGREGAFEAAISECAHRSGVGMVVCGHSHLPGIVLDKGLLWINPGSAGPRRFKLPRTCGLLSFEGDKVSARILDLEAPHTWGDAAFE